ncbi:hypothetical protein KSP39_PZI007576 [Platanthera zijinensis]|uniref:Uncharacterized protein n=1 Tax=Platanthera zijinensis TaxID=2320716 RepID=A0AAP0G8W8_9ASPA
MAFAGRIQCKADQMNLLHMQLAAQSVAQQCKAMLSHIPLPENQGLNSDIGALPCTPCCKENTLHDHQKPHHSYVFGALLAPSLFRGLPCISA